MVRNIYKLYKHLLGRSTTDDVKNITQAVLLKHIGTEVTST